MLLKPNSMKVSGDIAEPTGNAPVAAATAVNAPGSGAFSTRLVGFWIFLVALIAAFGRSLWLLFAGALQNDLNSYIVLIPFVSAYFLYIDRPRICHQYQAAVGWAALAFIAGSGVLMLFVVGAGRSLSANNQTALIAFSFVCFVWSGALLFLGRKWIASAAFPIFFLVFLVPLPDQVVDWLETGLRVASAEVANALFTLTGTPALKTGTIFELPGITIQVAQECSGIRSSWVLFITSLVAAQLFLTKSSSRIALVAAVIPLGILRNGFRIMVIALLCIHVDPEMIHSVIHRRGGPIFFVVSLVPLLLILWFLKRREMSPPRASAVRPT